MIGYVLLIVIAISLSTAVFFYLKLYLPDERPECEEDIRLTIDFASCVYDATNFTTSSIVKLNITNRGLFKVDGAYVKIGDSNRAFKTDLNPTLQLSSGCNDYNLSLNPSKTFCGTFSYASTPSIEQELSVQPVIFVNNEPVLCSNAVVAKKINCVAPTII